MLYDVIIPMGDCCAPAHYLSTSEKRICAFPFDWITPLSFCHAVNLIENHFENFFDKENLEPCDSANNEHVGYCDNHEKLFFYHDFSDYSLFDKEYSEIKKKYDRRIQRLYQFIKDSQDILYVHVGAVKTEIDRPEDDFAAFNRLKSMYPNKKHHLLYIFLSDEKRAKGGFEKIDVSDDIDYYICYEDSIIKKDNPRYAKFQTSIKKILSKYKVRRNFGYLLKRLNYRLFYLLSKLTFNKKIKSKVKSYYKEYR